MKPQSFAVKTSKFNNLIELVPPSLTPSVIEKRLGQIAKNLKPPIREAFEYHFANPGKMIRANMAYQAARLRGHGISGAEAWAVCIELLHNASLVHDDVCDSDSCRRDQPTVNKKFGIETAICLGDVIMALSFDEVSRDVNLVQTIPNLARTVADLSAGQALEFSPDFDFTWSEYERLVALKTAPLFKLPILGLELDRSRLGHSSRLLDHYFGLAALAYQIENDIRDISEGLKESSIASDCFDGRPNAVAVLFLESLSDEERRAFLSEARGLRAAGQHDDSLSVMSESWWRRLIESDALMASKAVAAKTLQQAESVADNIALYEKPLILPMAKFLSKKVGEATL